MPKTGMQLTAASDLDIFDKLHWHIINLKWCYNAFYYEIFLNALFSVKGFVKKSLAHENKSWVHDFRKVVLRLNYK